MRAEGRGGRIRTRLQLVNGTGFQTRAGLTTGFQGYGYGSQFPDPPKPLPAARVTPTRHQSAAGFMFLDLNPK